MVIKNKFMLRAIKHEQRDIIYSWVGKLNFISFHPNIIYRFTTISMKSVGDFLGKKKKEMFHKFN